MQDPIDIATQFEKHISSPKQTWLLGAGVSRNSNIPLMKDLTIHVLELARTEIFLGEDDVTQILNHLETDICNDTNIEHILTHLCDYISLANRSRNGSVGIGENAITAERLISIHQSLLSTISDVVRLGYKPPTYADNGEVLEVAVVGTPDATIVKIDAHSAFVKAIFGATLAGLEDIRSPVEFFTTNYDTLLEDALALNQITYQDGFIGGGVAFWDDKHYLPQPATRALVTKLHGSVDWHRQHADPSPLFRVRKRDSYPGNGGGVMIYPQAIKYLDAQRDPFSRLFQRFRHRLEVGKDQVLLICGYSFGDEHINAEIAHALRTPRNQLTLVAFSEEQNGRFPSNSC